MSPTPVSTTSDTDLPREQLVRELEELKARVTSLVHIAEARSELAAIVTSSDDAIIGKTLDGTITSWNKSAGHLYGYSESEAVGKPIEMIVPADRRQELHEILLSIRHGERVEHRETERITKDGRRIDVSVTVSPIMDAAGDVVGASTIARDITGQMRARKELKRANRAINAISKCNEAVIHAREESSLLYDVCGLMVEAGGYRMAWIGYAMDDENKSIKPMANAGVTKDYVKKARITWADTERGRGPVGISVRTGEPSVIKNVTTDTSFSPWRDMAIKMRYNSVISLPLMDNGRTFGVMAIYSEKPDAFDPDEISLLRGLASNLAYGILSIRDRKKRSEAEDALRAAKADAELYVDLMGHDINNLSQVGLGFIELAGDIIETRGSLGREDIELLDKARDSLRSISRLIDNVRKLQKEKKGLYEPEIIDIDTIVGDIVEHFPAPGDRNVKISRHAGSRCNVKANVLLRDVFINLIENAVKHSKGDLDVNIRTGRENGNKKAYCRISVEDNGPGIPDALKASLFERLDLNTTRVKGKGFGLYLIKTVIDDFHGKFWVEDRVEGDYTRGARFIVLLPAVENR